MSDRWHQLTVFIRVAESGSFSQAAKDLRLSQPSVSRIITALEERLGVKLLIRTTRYLTLTDAGSALLDKARDVLARMEEAEHATQKINTLEGTIRLALPVIYGTRAIMPLLQSFIASYPSLHVEISMADERQNLVVEGVDLAIRIGALPDSTFGGRKIATLERMIVASPAYLAKNGTPATPSDLASHDCILGHGAFGRASWRFKHGDTVLSIDVRSRVTINSGAGIMAACVQGLGIAMLSDVMSSQEQADGKLVRILRDYSLDPVDVFAIYPSGPKPSRKVRLLTDHLVDGLREQS